MEYCLSDCFPDYGLHHLVVRMTSYSDKAREIANEICGSSHPAYSLALDLVHVALSEAHATGREEMKEEAAKIVDAEDARVLACQSGETDPFKVGFDVDRNIRMTTVLLPNIASAIRSIPTKKEG